MNSHLQIVIADDEPEMRQYFFESEKDGMPFSRDKRAVVYQRAKMALDKRPFGTQYDVYAEGFEWLRHSMMPRPLATVIVGGMLIGPVLLLVVVPALQTLFLDWREEPAPVMHEDEQDMAPV